MQVITLEDDKEYYIIDTIEIENIKYVYLSCVENQKLVCIRKLVDNEENIAGLDTEAEYFKALDAYKNKHSDMLDA